MENVLNNGTASSHLESQDILMIKFVAAVYKTTSEIYSKNLQTKQLWKLYFDQNQTLIEG